MISNPLLSALRQYSHNNGEGFVFGYDKAETDRIVTGLVEALGYISKKSHDALKVTDNRAGRAKDEIMCGYAEHIIQMCDAAPAAHRKGGDP